MKIIYMGTPDFAVEALEATGKTPGREFHDHFLEDYR